MPEQPSGVHLLDFQAKRLFDRIEEMSAHLRKFVMAPVPPGSRRATRRRRLQSLLDMPPEESERLLQSQAVPGLMTDLEEWLGPMAPTLLQYIQPVAQLPPGQEEQRGLF